VKIGAVKAIATFLMTVNEITFTRVPWNNVILRQQEKMLATPKWQGQGILLSYPCTGLNRPLGFHEVRAPVISRQSAHKGGKAVSPTHQPPLPPPLQKILLVLTPVRGWVDPRAIVRQKDEVNEKFHWRHREWNPRPSGL